LYIVLYTLEDIAKVCGGTIVSRGNPFPLVKVQYFCYDSRILTIPGETVFIALDSGRRDGHTFIQELRDKGVRQFIVKHIPDIPGSANYLVVEDPLLAMQKLAAYHRRQFDCPVIGITGSNGKTIIKEWIIALTGQDIEWVRSPGSFNSQLGVPVSVLRLRKYHEAALFEAGISQVGEMKALEEIIRPDIAILSHMGDAHAEGFESFEDKVREKLLLAANANVCITLASQRPLLNSVKCRIRCIGIEPDSEHWVEHLKEKNNGWSFRLKGVSFELNQPGSAALENAWLAIAAALEIGFAPEVLAERMAHLTPVSMRTEMITDNPRTTIVNDACTSDPDSFRNALRLLNRMQAQPHKMAILSDLDHLGKETQAIQKALLSEAVNMLGKENLLLVGPVFCKIAGDFGVAAWPDLDAMLNSIQRSIFNDATVLLKGARRFALERMIPLLSEKVSATRFTIDLSRLVFNYRKLKSYISQDKKVMAMVKASAYGSGSWEVAQELQAEGVDYLAVAYIAEGISLREHGIHIPVMVMNPDPEGIIHLPGYRLEPAVYSLDFLEMLHARIQPGPKSHLKIHIEVETGMMRLGFPMEELHRLIDWLELHPEVEVVSVFTHLAAAEDRKEDDFTARQVTLLATFCQRIAEVRTGFLVHAQNTAASMRLNTPILNMVRLGIGLYGINPLSHVKNELQEVGTLSSRISQIHFCPKGESVGYNRKWIADRDSRIATIPLGYADGLPRILSDTPFGFRIKGRVAPIAGTICMDMTMVDVTDIPEVKPGDEVLIFGELDGIVSSVTRLADAAGTIPYDIITGIHPRVRRVFIRE
jgi:Alr-MurF fusion protein